MYDERESDWSLGNVDETAVPPSHKSLAEFNLAMDNWDDDAADAAVANRRLDIVVGNGVHLALRQRQPDAAALDLVAGRAVNFVPQRAVGCRRRLQRVC